jgi:hypothetical protein
MKGAALGLDAFEIRQPADGAGHHGREQRLLAGEVRVDGRLARRRQLGDVVDAGTTIALLEKKLLGRVKDPDLDVAGKVFGAVCPVSGCSSWSSVDPPVTSLCARRSHLTWRAGKGKKKKIYGYSLFNRRDVHRDQRRHLPDSRGRRPWPSDRPVDLRRE